MFLGYFSLIWRLVWIRNYLPIWYFHFFEEWSPCRAPLLYKFPLDLGLPSPARLGKRETQVQGGGNAVPYNVQKTKVGFAYTFNPYPAHTWMKSSKKLWKFTSILGNSSILALFPSPSFKKKFSQRVGRGYIQSSFIECVCRHDVFPGKTLKLTKI